MLRLSIVTTLLSATACASAPLRVPAEAASSGPLTREEVSQIAMHVLAQRGVSDCRVLRVDYDDIGWEVELVGIDTGNGLEISVWIGDDGKILKLWEDDAPHN